MKILSTIIFCLLTALAWAQQNAGTLVYEFKANLHRQLPPDNQDMKAMIPEFRTSRFQLLFTPQASLYKAIEEEEDEEDMHQGGGMRIRINAGNDEIYRDLTNRRRIEKREFMGQDYHIDDTLKTAPWKMSAERKTVMGFDCMKATWADTTNKRDIVAWFAPTIPVPSGPDIYTSLPGLVLEVDINNGERVIRAQTAEWKQPSEKALKAPKAPKDGKSLTVDEYRSMVDEQMKKMGGGRGGMRIMRN